MVSDGLAVGEVAVDTATTMRRIIDLFKRPDQQIIAARLERHVLTKGAAVREAEAIICNTTPNSRPGT